MDEQLQHAHRRRRHEHQRRGLRARQRAGGQRGDRRRPGRTSTPSAPQLASLCKELAREIAARRRGRHQAARGATSPARPTGPSPTDIARAIAGSTLVKAAIFGADPNWGRVLATVGARAGSHALRDRPRPGEGHHAGRAASTTSARLDARAGRQRRQRGPRAGPKARMREPRGARGGRPALRRRRRAPPGAATSRYDYVKINADYTSLLVPTADGSVEKDDRLTNYSPRVQGRACSPRRSTYISRFAGKRVVLKVGRADAAQGLAAPGLLRGREPLARGGPGADRGARRAPRAPAKHDAKHREVLLTGPTNTDLVTHDQPHRRHRHRDDRAGRGLLRARPGAPVHDGLVMGELEQVNTELLELFLARGIRAGDLAGRHRRSRPRSRSTPTRWPPRSPPRLGASKLVYLTGRAGFIENDELLRQVSAPALKTKLDHRRLHPQPAAPSRRAR